MNNLVVQGMCITILKLTIPTLTLFNESIINKYNGFKN